MIDELKVESAVKNRHAYLSIIVMIVALAAMVLVGCGQSGGQQEGQIPDASLLLKATETGASTQDVTKKEWSDDTECVFVLPEGFFADDAIDGLYITKDYPVVSANVYYSRTEDASRDEWKNELTAQAYSEMLATAYQGNTSDEIQVSVDSFEQIEVDGCMGYRIRTKVVTDASENISGVNEMEQLTYIVIGDRVYTVTYSQAADDEKMELFEESAKTIHVGYTNWDNYKK